MRATTHITNRDDPTQQITVTLDATVSEEPQVFHNTAMEHVADMQQPVSKDSPYLTFVAVESACMSGAFYARRKLDVKGVAVELISYSMTGRVQNAQPFAVAMMIGICEAITNSSQFGEAEMCGWNLVSVEREWK